MAIHRCALAVLAFLVEKKQDDHNVIFGVVNEIKDKITEFDSPEKIKVK